MSVGNWVVVGVILVQGGGLVLAIAGVEQAKRRRPMAGDDEESP